MADAHLQIYARFRTALTEDALTVHAYDQVAWAALWPTTKPTAHRRNWGWVGDTRGMGAIPQEVQQWRAESWNPRAYAAGIREISAVVS